MVATIKLLSIKKVSTLKFWGELSLEGGGGGGGGGILSPIWSSSCHV